MKRVSCLLLALCLLLCGCLQDPLQQESTAPETTAQPAETSQAPTQTTQAVRLVERVEFVRTVTENAESATLTAYGFDGTVEWIYQTDYYPVAQLYRVSDIGANGGLYYIVEDGAILAFDYETGRLYWQNKEFIGSPANENCFAFDEEGNLYICGFLGPDLFVVDPYGKTLARVGCLNNDYYWASRLTLFGDWISVRLDAGPDWERTEPYFLYLSRDAVAGSALTQAQAIALVEKLYNDAMDAEGTYVVFEEECYTFDNTCVLTVRYQLSDKEAQLILANGGTPEANTYVETVCVDLKTGYMIPQA